MNTTTTRPNVGSRMYQPENDSQCKTYKLRNQEAPFDVDVSNIPCGFNGALYFV